MARCDDNLVAGLIGGIALLFVIDSVISIPKPKPKPEQTIHAADGIGALWVDQRIDGFIASFHLGRIEKSNLSGTIAFTDGFYEEDNPGVSAEIIMMMPPFGKRQRCYPTMLQKVLVFQNVIKESSDLISTGIKQVQVSTMFQMESHPINFVYLSNLTSLRLKR